MKHFHGWIIGLLLLTYGQSKAQHNLAEQVYPYYSRLAVTADFQHGAYLSTLDAYQRNIFAEDFGKQVFVNPHAAEAIVWNADFRGLTNVDSLYETYVALLPNGPNYFLQLNSLAKLAYQNRNYEKSITLYNKVDNTFLSNDLIVEKNFNLAYSYLMTDQKENILPLFASLKNIRGAYFEPGNYYYGLMKYYNREFDEAYQSFIKIAADPFYKKVVPFYICEIQYSQGEKDQALNRAEQYLATADKLYYRPELNLLAGRIYFERNDYEKALPFLLEYMAGASNIRREDIFLLGYTNYKLKDYKKAITVLDRVQDIDDSLSQMSCFAQAECYLQLGKKQEALYSYSKCAELALNDRFTEVAKYNHARLSYELGLDKEALNSAYNLVKLFPNSIYKDDCLALVSSLIEQTSNYDKAIEVSRKMEQNEITKASQQRLYYNDGLSKFAEKKYTAATTSLQEASAIVANKEIATKCIFWLSEIAYQQGEYPVSIAYAKRFLKDPTPIDGDVSENSAIMLLAYNYLNLSKQDSVAYYVNYIKNRNDKNFYIAHKNNLDKLYNMVDQLAIIAAERDTILYQLYPFLEKQPALCLEKLDSMKIWRNLTPAQKNKIVEYATIANFYKGDYSNTKLLLDSIGTEKSSQLFFIEGLVYLAEADSNDAVNSFTTMVEKGQPQAWNLYQMAAAEQLFKIYMARLDTEKSLPLVDKILQFPMLEARKNEWIATRDQLLQTLPKKAVNE